MTDDPGCVCDYEVRNGDVDVDLTDDWVLGERFAMETDQATGEALWRCYRRPNGDDDRCLFHMDPETRRERGLDDETMAELLVAVVNDELDDVLGDADDGGLLVDETPPGCRPLEIVTNGEGGCPDDSPDMLKKRRLQFIGATFGDLNLSYEKLAPPSSYNIDLVGMEAGKVNLRHARVENNIGLGRWGGFDGLDLGAATIDAVFDARRLTVDGDVTLSNAEVEYIRLDRGTVAGDVKGFSVNVSRGFKLNELDADSDVTLHGANVDGNLHGKDMMIGGELSVRYADANEISFNSSQINGRLRGDNLQTERRLFLSGATARSVSIDEAEVGTAVFAGGLEVTGVDDDGETEAVDEEEARGSFSFRKSRTGEFTAGGIEVAGNCKFWAAEFRTILKLDDSSIGGTVDISSVTANIIGLQRAEVGGEVEAQNVDVDGSLVLIELGAEGEVDFRWSTLRGLSLEGAEVGSVNGLRAEMEESAVFENVLVENSVHIEHATLGTDIDAEGLTTGGHLSLSGSEVDGSFSLERAVVEGDVVLDETHLMGDVDLADGTFVDGDLSLVETVLDGEVSVLATTISGTVVVDDAELSALVFEDVARFGRLAVCDARVNGSLRLGDCRNLPLTAGGVYVTNSEFWRVVVDGGDGGRPILGGPLVLQDSVVEDRLSLPVDCFRHPGVRAVSLAGSRIPDAELALDDPAVSTDERAGRARSRGVAPAYRTEGTELVYDLSDATVGQLETVGEGSSDLPSYYQFRFWTTEFERFRFGEHRADFADIDWAVHELRPWGDQDVAAVTEAGRGLRSKPDTARGLASVLSPAFVDAHEQAIDGLSRLLANGSPPSPSAFEEVDGTELTFPTPSTGDVGQSTTRAWETAVDVDPVAYGTGERAVLDRPDTDHTGAVITAVFRIRQQLVSAMRDAYNDRGVVSAGDGRLALSSPALDRITVDAVRGCLAAIGGAGDGDSDSLVADHVESKLGRDDPVTAAVGGVLDELDGSPLHGSALADGFDETPDGDWVLPGDGAAALNERLGDSEVGIADVEAFEGALVASSDRLPTRTESDGVDPADVPLRALHADVVAEAVSEVEVALRQVVQVADPGLSSSGDSDGAPAPTRMALVALVEDLEHDFREESLASALPGWEFDPQSRVRTDVWNAATGRAYRTAAEGFDDRPDLRGHRLQQLEGTYTLAKKAAADVGENAAASKLHYRQREYARALHEHNGRRWVGLKANFLRLLTGYGEKPQWVVACAAGVIAVWTGLFALVQATTDALPDAGPLELLSLSVGSFATLLPPSPVAGPDGHGVVVRLLTETEALLGVFLVAVFVFTLTKSLQR